MLEENWYKKININEKWIKKNKNKQYFDSLKIVSILNLRNKKRVKVEFCSGQKTLVRPEWLFYNYKRS